jgi:hypothetical protein
MGKKLKRGLTFAVIVEGGYIQFVSEGGAMAKPMVNKKWWEE